LASQPASSYSACATQCCQDKKCVAAALYLGICYTKTLSDYKSQTTVSQLGVTLITLVHRVPSSSVNWTQQLLKSSKRSILQIPESTVIRDWIVSQVPDATNGISVHVNPLLGGFQVVTHIADTNSHIVASAIVDALNNETTRASLEIATNSSVNASSVQAILQDNSHITPAEAMSLEIVGGIAVLSLIVVFVLVVYKFVHKKPPTEEHY